MGGGDPQHEGETRGVDDDLSRIIDETNLPLDQGARGIGGQRLSW